MTAVFFVILVIGGLLLGPWVLMLLVGGLHSFVPEVPALGFWPCLIISVICSILFGGGSSRS